MRTKNNYLVIFFVLLAAAVFSQETKFFFIEIPNNSNIPVVTHDKSGIRKAYVKTSKSDLNKLINDYKIYSIKRVFTKSKKKSLENIYLIECDNLDLMNKLRNKFKEYYPRTEVAGGVPLTTPDDYGTTGGYLSAQDELDFIRAQEAWDITTGSNDIKIGISDTNFIPNHEDLLGTLSIEVNENSNNINGNQHGSRVSSFAGANTNNGFGIASIGYNSFIYAGVAEDHLSDAISVLHDLSSLDGVKVVNASWLISGTTSSDGSINQTALFYEPVIDEIINDRNIVIIAAAGNGQSNPGNPNSYVFPASYKDVISVSSVGHINKTYWDRETFMDEHEYLRAGEIRSHQHNDSIDIVAPGYGMVSANNWDTGLTSYSGNKEGTSYSAPIVAGTVALMFDVNYCLDPKEVETILKLTAVKIDTLPQNIQYYGKLGAGKLDAYEAVKMAKDMADALGTVEVKNRILYRPWFYKLVTAPYEIKMINNDVTGGSKLKFKARNNIEILSGDYYPSMGGYIDLSIDETLALDCNSPPVSSSKNISKKQNANINGAQVEGFDNGYGHLSVFPNPTTGVLNITNKENLTAISILDITGKIVYSIKNINSNELQVNMSKFNSGVYFMTIKIETGKINTQKIIKN